MKGSQNRNSGKRAWGRNWKGGDGRISFLACSPCLAQFASCTTFPGTTCSRSTLPHQCLVKKMPYALAQQAIWQRHFLNWGSSSQKMLACISLTKQRRERERYNLSNLFNITCTHDFRAEHLILDDKLGSSSLCKTLRLSAIIHHL